MVLRTARNLEDRSGKADAAVGVDDGELRGSYSVTAS